MSTATKVKRVSVVPVSIQAKNRFFNTMDRFHMCTVENEKKIDGVDHLFLVSMNRQYCFWVPRKGNEHWKIEK